MSDRQFACATEAHERLSPGSCGGLFSEEFPSGARDSLLSHPTLRTLLPNLVEATWRPSRLGRPHWPPEAPLPCFNFLRLAQPSQLCNPLPSCVAAPCCDFLRIATDEPSRKPSACGKDACFVGKSAKPLSFNDFRTSAVVK